MKKRSISIAGHRTSIALEDEFWILVQKISVEMNLSIPKLLELIENQKKSDNLASAIRLYVLDYSTKNRN
ncbi:MAG: ribbon-helix-helix domain-containing protein [Rhizobiales bacterium]|jgi:predicted DNA-binding ribbon-helix-helix protein|nr:ribbon-helix-helix domain-containing protein [Hyphomicrobiales bacterium]MBL6770320.1 ribbon-helix-helix domain-containing protein [Hyphomicrobiales bacterium]